MTTKRITLFWGNRFSRRYAHAPAYQLADVHGGVVRDVEGPGPGGTAREVGQIEGLIQVVAAAPILIVQGEAVAVVLDPHRQSPRKVYVMLTWMETVPVVTVKGTCASLVILVELLSGMSMLPRLG